MDQSEYLEIQKSQSGLYLKFQNLRDNQLSWYKNEVLKCFCLKRLPSTNLDQLINQVLGKSPNDQSKKEKGRTYYVANVISYLRVIKTLLTDEFIEKFCGKTPIDDLVVYNYHRVFNNLLFDSLILLNDYSDKILQKPNIYRCGKNQWQHNLTLYQSLRQSIFGQASLHSFIEVEPDLSISIIRQLVELRVRRAFGILGWYEPTTQSIEPLSMKTLFEVIKKYENDIDFSIPLDCLNRIYGWSNIFLHSGIKDYCWKPILVMDYLREFALGKSSSYNVNSGIVVKQNRLNMIIEELENNHPKCAEVIRCHPEASLLNA